MGTNNGIQISLLGRTANILSRVLDFRSANQQVISENLANIDTPGFKARDLRFDEELRRASDKTTLRLTTTDPDHFSYPDSSDFSKRDFPAETTVDDIYGPGQLNIDMEMAKMMRNNLLYEATSRLLTKKIQALRSVIEDGRR